METKHKHKDVVVKRVDGELVVTSRQVAEDFDKRHADVLRAIEDLNSENAILRSQKYFIETYYKVEGNNKNYKEYLLTRDGFSLLVMGFTGSRALEWKLKYIEAFNKMEQAVKNPYGHLSKEVQAIFALDHKQQQLAVEVKELKDGMPLFNVECKELQAAVRRKGIEVLCGKGSQAYKDNSLRGKVYADIQHQIKREFGVTRYEAIKRSQLNKAIEIVSQYKVPYVLGDEITKTNSQIDFKEVI